MSIAAQVEPILIEAARQDDAGQARMVRALEAMGPAALTAVYIAGREALADRSIDGMDLDSIDGLFSGIKKFVSKVGKGVSRIAKRAAPVAAPFLGLIPGIGPALSAGASALAVPPGTPPEQAQAIYAQQQRAAAAQIRNFAGWVQTGRIDPAALAKVQRENAALRATVNARRKADQGKILGMPPGVALAAVGVGVFVLAKGRR